MTRIAALLVTIGLLTSAAIGVAQQAGEPPLAGETAVEDLDVTVEGAQPLPDPWEEENGSFLVNLIQGLLSAPGRQVQIRGISGVLSSSASIEEIRVSDAEGVWLRVENVEIDWSRRALLLRRVQVDELTIGAIEYLRPALPPEPTGPQLADAEARSFALPELPLAVRVETLDLQRLVIGEPVFGQAAEMIAGGYVVLDGGEVDSDLRLTRTDAPGGEIRLQAAFSNESRVLALDLAVSEPAGGVLATALDIEGRPALELALQGSGPLDALDLDFSLDADGARLATGEAALRQAEDGLGFVADFAGRLSPLVPPEYRDFFGGESTVRVAGVSKAGGGLRLDQIDIASAALSLAGALETGPDAFLQHLDLAGRIGDPDAPPGAAPITLPVPGGQTRLDSGEIEIRYGEGDAWQGRLALEGLTTAQFAAEVLRLDMSGLARNLQDPASRNVTLELAGSAVGLSSPDPALARALGERVDLAADLVIPAGAPIALRAFEIDGAGILLAAHGEIADLVLSGDYRLEIADLRPFSGLAERALRGAAEVSASGELFLDSGGFDLALDGTATGLRLGQPQIDPLLTGETRLTGGIARDAAGLRTDGLRIANQQLELTSTGRVSAEQTDVGFSARLADLSLLLPDAAGAVTAQGRAVGAEGALDFTLEAAIPSGQLLKRSLADLALRFEGAIRDGDVTGTLSGAGALDGNDIALSGDVVLAGETRRLSGLALRVGPNTITGDLARIGEAPVSGQLGIDAPDLAPLAALALREASGSATAQLTLAPIPVGEGIGQGVGATAEIRDLVLDEFRIGALDLRADIADAFGIPIADAQLDARDVAAGGIALASLSARAEQTGPEAMAFTAETVLAIGTEARLAGNLERLEDGLAVALTELALAQNGMSAALIEPATVTIAGEAITLTPLALDLGEGRIEAAGSIADELDIDLRLDSVGLALANAIRPDLALGGVVDGTARVTGPRDAPAIAFDLDAVGVTAAVIAALPPVSLAATGSTEGAILTIDGRLAAAAGLDARMAGTVPLDGGPLDLAADIAALPLALLDPFLGNQELAGTVTGTARLTGSFEAPDIAFDLQAADVAAASLTGLPPLALQATGRTNGERLGLDAALSAPGGLAATATGSLPLGEGEIDLGVNLAALPLPVLDALAGGRGLQGDVAGTGRVTGTLALPELDFALTGSGLSSNDTRTAGLPSFGIEATGTSDGQAVDFAASVTAPGGLQAEAAGSVPLGGGPVALTVELGALPLALIDPLAGDQGLSGSVSGSGDIGGTLAAPEASFSLSASGLSTAALREAGVPALSASATGRFGGGTLSLTQATIGGGGIEAIASGTIPLTGPGLSVSTRGTLPLALANPALAERAAQLAGSVAFDLAITGSLGNPQIVGPVTASGATFVDPQSNIRLDNIVLDARLDGQNAAINTFTARGTFGGRVSAAGNIGLGEGFPVDLAIAFNNLAYTDGTLVATRLSGDLRLSGPVAAGGGLLVGDVELDATEISVAEGLGAGGTARLEDVIHRNPPPRVAQTLGRARIEAARTAAEPQPNGLALDILVRAPNQIFVRGRGLDVELGGELRVTGSINDILPAGEFSLIRGRLNVLGQRIDFEEGSLQLVGSLDPIVFFVARTVTPEATAIVTVSGNVSAPDITFSSVPELPQDEVLALVIFNRSVQQLSPFQIAQLAAAAAELAGAGGNGLLAQFRGAVGLDDLDIIADEQGGAALRAGRYIDDNIYLDVQTGSGGDTRLSINLDITDNVTARGAVGTDGNSTLGIYYQRDY